MIESYGYFNTSTTCLLLNYNVAIAFVCLFVCVFVCVCVCLFVCLFVCCLAPGILKDFQILYGKTRRLQGSLRGVWCITRLLCRFCVWCIYRSHCVITEGPLVCLRAPRGPHLRGMAEAPLVLLTKANIAERCHGHAPKSINLRILFFLGIQSPCRSPQSQKDNIGLFEGIKAHQNHPD